MRKLLTLLESHNNEDLATALKADMETQTDTGEIFFGNTLLYAKATVLSMV